MANEKILVVDDDTNICELLRLYLTKEDTVDVDALQLQPFNTSHILCEII